MSGETVFSWYCPFCKCGGGYTNEATDLQKQLVCREAAAHDACAKFEASEAVRKARSAGSPKPQPGQDGGQGEEDDKVLP